MIKIVYIAIKEEGKAFRVVNSKLLKTECDSLPNGRYKMTIEKYRKNKSNPQLGYLFAGVYPLVLQALNDQGWEFTSIDEVDIYCKSMFAVGKKVNRTTGEIIDVPELKRKMTTVEMMTYIDAIRDWCAEYLNCYIPEPETNLEMKFKDAKPR
jgi:hypothetical protein